MAIQLIHSATIVAPSTGSNFAINGTALTFPIPTGHRRGDLVLITFAINAQTTPTGIGSIDAPMATPTLGAGFAGFDSSAVIRFRENYDFSVSGSPNRYCELSVCSNLTPIADCSWATRRFTTDSVSPSLVQEYLAVLRIYREVHNSGPSQTSNIRHFGPFTIERAASTNVQTPFSDLDTLVVGDLITQSILTPYGTGEVTFTPNANFGNSTWILVGNRGTLAVSDSIWPFGSWTGADTAIPAGTSIGTFDVARAYVPHNMAFKSGGTPGAPCARWHIGSVGIGRG